MEKQINEIIIYENNGKDIEVRVESETVWLNLNQISALFGKDKSNISRHIKNIYKEGELVENSVVAKNATTASDGKTYQVEYYNLDMIISIGYRVNSKNATTFRIWATSILKKYLTQGYAINERLVAQYADKFKALQQIISVLERTAVNQIDNLDPMMKELLNVVSDFATGFNVLDNYDHELLDGAGTTKKEAIFISVEEFLTEVQKAQKQFGGLFGIPKDDSFASSVGQIYQSFGGKELYPSLEEKAANLLYLITKNHSFADGNKRIAATCFLYFMAKNGMLFDAAGRKTLDDYAMAALTLLIAQSAPGEKETMCKLVITILNKRRFNPSLD